MVIDGKVFKELLYDEIKLQHFPNLVDEYLYKRAEYEQNLEAHIQQAMQEDIEMEEETLDEEF